MFDFKFPTAAAHPARRRSHSQRRLAWSRVEAMLNYASLALRPLPDFYLSSFSKAALAFLWNVLGARLSRSRRTKKNKKRNETKNKPNRPHRECLTSNTNKTKPSQGVLKICYRAGYRYLNMLRVLSVFTKKRTLQRRILKIIIKRAGVLSASS